MPFVLNAVTGWHDAGETAAHTQWARAVIDAAVDATTGRAYVNFLGRRGCGALVLRGGDVRAPAGAEARVRPDERVPAQPEHRPERRGLTRLIRSPTASRSGRDAVEHPSDAEDSPSLRAGTAPVKRGLNLGGPPSKAKYS